MTGDVLRKSAPAKPQIPPILLCAIAAWVTLRIVFPMQSEWTIQALVIIAVASVLVIGALIVYLITGYRLRASHWSDGVLRVVAVLLLGACLAFCVSGLYSLRLHQANEWISRGVFGDLAFVMEEDAREGLYGSYGIARCSADDVSVLVEVQFNGVDCCPRYGQAFVASGTLLTPKDAKRQSFWEQGVVATCSVSNVTMLDRDDLLSAMVNAREKVLASLADARDGYPNEIALFAALLCGYREWLIETSLYQDFKTAGLAHVVAVSGAHLSIAVSLAAALLGVIRFPRVGSVVVQILFVAGYLVFAGAPLSALRAAIMACTSLLSYFSRRKSASLNALGICILAIVSTSPQQSCSVSLLLSAGSTFGIIAFTPLLSYWISTAFPTIPKAIAEVFAITFAANTVTLPVSVGLFSQLPLIAPLSSAITALFVTAVCCLGIMYAACLCLLPIVSFALLGVSLASTHALSAIVSACASVPFGCIPATIDPLVGAALSSVVSGAMLLFWPTPSKHVVLLIGGGFVVAASLLFVLMPNIGGPELVMLDVGQGDAFLLQDGFSKILIDTGTNDALLKQALARQGVTKLDAVVITHGDDDHYGSLASLRGLVSVDAVYLASDALSCTCNNCTSLIAASTDVVGLDRIYPLTINDTISLGRLSAQVVWPLTFQDKGGNGDSLCLKVLADVDGDNIHDGSALLVGDAESDQIATLLSRGVADSIDIFKVGHHGSKAAITSEQALTLDARIALISVGAENRYGHPAQSTLEALENAGSSIFRTDERGDVRCSFTSEGIVVSTQK